MKLHDVLVFQMKHYPRDMFFWGQKDLTYMAKLSGLKDVVNLLSKHESYAKMDAQVTFYPLYHTSFW